MTPLLIFAIGLISVLGFNHWVRYRRFCHHNAMSRTYDEMVMYFFRGKIYLTDDYVRLLRIYHRACLTPHLLNLHEQLLTSMDTTWTEDLRLSRDWYQSTINSLDPDLSALIAEFDYHARKMGRLSISKPGFVLFALSMILYHFRLLVKKGAGAFVLKWKMHYRYIRSYDLSVLDVELKL